MVSENPWQLEEIVIGGWRESIRGGGEEFGAARPEIIQTDLWTSSDGCLHEIVSRRGSTPDWRLAYLPLEPLLHGKEISFCRQSCSTNHRMTKRGWGP